MKKKVMRFKVVLFFTAACLFMACNDGQQLESKDGFAIIPEAKSGEAIATYAGGCFWALQECMLELKGVHKVISGYAGGSKVNPTYAEVLTQSTGHAESVQVYYDPKIISFETLTTAFFHAHNPTQVDRQGPDVGTDYRSIAFYRSPAESRAIQNIISKINDDGIYKTRVVTENAPFKVIYPAEMEHQDYYPKNTWDGYIRHVSKPKVMKLRKEMPEWIKDKYKNE